MNQHSCTLKGFNSKPKKSFCCINVDRTTTLRLQMEIFEHLLCFQANLQLRLGLPSKYIPVKPLLGAVANRDVGQLIRVKPWKKLLWSGWSWLCDPSLVTGPIPVPALVRSWSGLENPTWLMEFECLTRWCALQDTMNHVAAATGHWFFFLDAAGYATTTAHLTADAVFTIVGGPRGGNSGQVMQPSSRYFG